MAAPPALLATLLAAALVGTGCGAAAPAAGRGRGADRRLQVVAAFYPLEHAVRRVGGDDLEVIGLTRPGIEPHDLELTARDRAALGEADLVVVLSGFQPAVDEVLEQESPGEVLDVADLAPLQPGFVPVEDGELHADEAGSDPHVWLEPLRYARIVRAVAERLGAVDPAGAAAYRERALAFSAELDTLHVEFTAGLRTCERRELVTSHNAFGYLARAYRLEQIAITGLTPEDEPTPARLAQVIDLSRKHRVTTVFFEDLVSPKVAQSLAREIGAVARVLTPLEGPPDEGDYVSAMRANLAALRAALGCP